MIYIFKKLLLNRDIVLQEGVFYLKTNSKVDIIVLGHSGTIFHIRFLNYLNPMA